VYVQAERPASLDQSGTAWLGGRPRGFVALAAFTTCGAGRAGLASPR
jgi:hypothetical protein